MRIRSLQCLLALSLCFAASAAAKEEVATDEAPDRSPIVFLPARNVGDIGDSGGMERGTAVHGHLVSKTALLTYHGGPTITSAKVVLIFWGPSFSNPGSADFAYAQSLVAFRNQLGTTPEYQTITEYSGIQTANFAAGTPDWFDTSAPPANVTDTAVQGEVNLYLASHTFDASTVYEVFLPSTSYSSSGSATSCGGPALSYCAYHSWIGSGASAVKYSVQPYPSCGGCGYDVWTAVQNQEHFVVHETREAATDPVGTGWLDSGGFEADDECNWSPPPFLGTGGYGYQFEWSNAAGGCITRPNAGPPPAPPTLLPIDHQCNLFNEADWTTSSGATAYELWASSSSTFATQSLRYSGSGTSYIFSIGTGVTLYFHVRACNANGCSGWSNTKSVRATVGNC